MEVKHPAGKFIQDMALAKNESRDPRLPDPAQPGLPGRGGGERRPASALLPDAEERILENLGKIATLNFIPAPRETVERILEPEKLSRAQPGAAARARSRTSCAR